MMNGIPEIPKHLTSEQTIALYIHFAGLYNAKVREILKLAVAERELDCVRRQLLELASNEAVDTHKFIESARKLGEPARHLVE